MLKLKSYVRSVALAVLLAFVTGIAWSQVPSPKEHFGFNIGDDYHLATFTQTEAYWKKLAAVSKLAKLEVIGQTEEGRNHYMMIVTSEANHAKLDRYKEISTKLARAEGIDDAAARQLAAEGKAVVWIDGGLHATETVGIHQLIETMYQILTRKDAETQRILDNVIILFVHANPDGQELVSNWYMREKDREKRSLSYLPTLYQKYIGHDNNRDFYIMNMKESRNMGNQLFVEWIPQIMYNHHQRGPAGSVLAGPPYRDPFNHVFDPMMVTGIDAVGAAMYNRLNAENKPGFTRLEGSTFSTWYNGGLRTTTHFHNMIGILTEIIGGPNPEDVPLVPERMIPNNKTPNPVMPQKTWHFRQSIDYSLSMNYAVLDYAARNSDHLLYNIYAMGKNSINKGSQDFWTPYPKKVEAIKTAFDKDVKAGKVKPIEGFRASTIPLIYYDSVFQAPASRDPRGYIIPSDQKDFATAIQFVNALIRTGIRVEKATDAFKVQGKSYAKGSYIVKTDQAFRPHILDMFEPQDYPNDFQYPGGPPIRPYDAAGWTLAFQMGAEYDRVLEGFDGPFEQVAYGEIQTPPATDLKVFKSGYMLSAQVNNSFIAVNDLLKAGIDVFRITEANGDFPAGSFYVPQEGHEILAKANAEWGTKAEGVKAKDTSGMVKIKPSRIALFDNYGGSMPSGWVRWLMEQFHFDFQVVFPKDIDAGNLNAKYDAILFISGGIPPVGGTEMRYGRLPEENEIPASYHHMLGSITPDKSVPQLKQFMEQGGKVVTIGSSTVLAYHLGLPVANALVELDRQGNEKPLPGEKYYVPGSILKIKTDGSHPANWGMKEEVDVMFNNNPVFKFKPEAFSQGVKALSWFDTDAPLKSGWGWGQSYLKDGITSFVAPVGKGQLYAFSPEITFRAQSHGTFKLLFNTLYQTQ